VRARCRRRSLRALGGGLGSGVTVDGDDAFFDSRGSCWGSGLGNGAGQRRQSGGDGRRDDVGDFGTLL